MSPLPLWLLASGLAGPPDPVAVSDANAAAPCQWPTVVSYRAGEDKCTGLLVHPEVIVTAGHCVLDSPAGGVRFGEQFQPAAEIIDAARCGVHPDYVATGAPSSDVGYCVLEAPMPGVPPTPILAGCETPWLQAGRPAVIVGFGTTPDDEPFGTKRYAFTVLDSDLREDGTVWVGDAEVNGCFGDSGGPAFVRSPDGTWHALGVLTYGPPCGEGPVLYRALFDRIAWLEAETGRDLTPCHDAEGTWDPGPDCGSISADPLAPARTWSEACAGELAEAPRCPEPVAPEASTTDEPATDSGVAADTDDEADAGCSCRTSAPRPGHQVPLAVVLLSLRRRRPARRWPLRRRRPSHRPHHPSP